MAIKLMYKLLVWIKSNYVCLPLLTVLSVDGMLEVRADASIVKVLPSVFSSVAVRPKVSLDTPPDCVLVPSCVLNESNIDRCAHIRYQLILLIQDIYSIQLTYNSSLHIGFIIRDVFPVSASMIAITIVESFIYSCFLMRGIFAPSFA